MARNTCGIVLRALIKAKAFVSSPMKTRDAVTAPECTEHTPLFTAVVATYNRANLVGKAIESILAQTYENIEIIVVDDGSTDATPSLLRQFCDQVTVIYQPNAGPSAARNRGIVAARGEIVAFLDSDDVWLPNRIERQVSVLQKVDESVPCCVCNVEMRFTSGPRRTSFQNALLDPVTEEGLWSNAAELLTDRFIMFNQMAAVRRSALERIGGYDESLRFLEDYDLALRLALIGPFAFIREPLVIWSQGSAGSLSDEASQQIRRLRELEVRIRQNLLEKVNTSGDHEALRAQMRSALTKANRRLWIAGLRQEGSSGVAMVGSVLDKLEHYYDAAIRRSPWFIPMKTRPLPEQPDSSATEPN